MKTNSYIKTSEVIGLAVILAAGVLTAEVRSAEYGKQSKAGSSGITQQDTGTREMRSVQRASELLNMTVKSRDGQISGKVEDIVLGADGRRVEHVSVSFDDIRGQINVPLNQLSLLQDGKTLSLAMSKADLQRQNQFATDQGTGSADRSRQLSQIPDSRRVSKLIGKDVQGAGGEQLGSINDLLINMDQGLIASAALETGGVMGVGSKFSSVDWPSVQVSADQKYVTINKTRQQLQDTATGEQEYWQRFGFDVEDDERTINRQTDDALKGREQMERDTMPLRQQPINQRNYQQP
jgi:sporulation protein YlmC with PRC-barrel domain